MLCHNGEPRCTNRASRRYGRCSTCASAHKRWQERNTSTQKPDLDLANAIIPPGRTVRLAPKQPILTVGSVVLRDAPAWTLPQPPVVTWANMVREVLEPRPVEHPHYVCTSTAGAYAVLPWWRFKEYGIGGKL